MELWNSEMMRLSKEACDRGLRVKSKADQNRTSTRKPNYFKVRLLFSSTMRGVCSAQVQAQNKHSRELKMERPSPCRRPLPILISTKAGLYITG